MRVLVQVKRAMNEINKMKRLRVAAQDEGEAVKIRAIKEAEVGSPTSSRRPSEAYQLDIDERLV